MLRALLIAGSAGAALFAVPANAQQVCLSGGPDGSRSVACGPAFSGLDARGRTELDSRYVRSTTAAAPAGRITSSAYADAPRRNIRSYSAGPDARFVSSTSYGGRYGRVMRAPTGDDLEREGLAERSGEELSLTASGVQLLAALEALAKR